MIFNLFSDHGNSGKSSVRRDDFLSALISKLIPDARPIIVSPSMSGGYAIPYLEAHGGTC